MTVNEQLSAVIDVLRRLGSWSDAGYLLVVPAIVAVSVLDGRDGAPLARWRGFRRGGWASVEVTRTVVVPKPLDAVTERLAGFRDVTAWHPRALSCVRLDTGRPRVGSRWRVWLRGSRVRFAVVYTLVRRGRHWITLTARRGPFAVTLDYACTDLDGITEVHTGARCVVRGPAIVLHPLLKRRFAALADAAIVELGRHLAD